MSLEQKIELLVLIVAVTVVCITIFDKVVVKYVEKCADNAYDKGYKSGVRDLKNGFYMSPEGTIIWVNDNKDEFINAVKEDWKDVDVSMKGADLS